MKEDKERMINALFYMKVQDVSVVKYILSKGFAVNYVAKRPLSVYAWHAGSTALLIAAYRGYAAIVAKLLEAKADVNKACNASGLTALLIAANGRAEVVAILLNDKNLDVNKANINGVTPLYIASQNGRDELVAQLRYSRGLFSGSVVSRRLNSLVEAYKVDDCY